MVERQKKKWLFIDASYIPLIFGAIVTIVCVIIVYNQTQGILKERLRERITSIVSTAVLSIDAEEVKRLIKLERADSDVALKSKELINIISYIRKVRDANRNIRYIYILDRNDLSENVNFTADAEMIDPIDIDGNGKIEDVEIPPAPGEDYDVSDVDVVSEIFVHPIAAHDLYTDKWGSFLSGYAPIQDSSGKVIAALAIDVQVDDFTKLVQATLIPFSVLALILLTMLTVQTVTLVKIWGNRVEIFKELDRQKDELISIVSHQLATPVSSVKWYLGMMVDGDFGKISDELTKHVHSMQSVVSDLADLVSTILDVSRIQLGRMKVDRTDLDLNEFFQSILEVIEPKAQERKVELTVSIPKDLPVGYLDKRLMRMTLENLLSNAVKYSDEKTGKVKFVVSVTNDVLSYFVKDNGCGIPKGEQDKIFGKLFRASNVRKVDGNGFGLYAAKGAIEAQSGSIRFESEEGKGTTFYVQVPLEKAKLAINGSS
ncbi:MAG: HAMP domain-containing sensor histidine kinase [Candidatus Peregrinibacteria bacterium]|nr:HAMP domain-containing sensor histidine kinase [Candidatus Peregrinibacteria bacterium]